ncbi:hypothetical protein SNE40_020056 [Patella caerulea]|uniref:GST C-terminal domain-containing protein n=1 Tax=Patella caerulea TaxID=87958 RepID=A0AAN8GDQ7_PATCE
MSEETPVYENEQANGSSDNPKQDFELYIKASAIDKETRGSCPICHQWFMMSYLMAENQEGVNFKVFTVQADCPPKNFLEEGWSKKFPVVKARSCITKTGQDISGMMYDTFEELEVFFESINKDCPELKRRNAPNVAAMKCVEDLYKTFNHYLQGKADTAMLTELKKLDEFLASHETKFLVDDVLSFSDCHLLPRLQHLRVAGKAYKEFEIPKEFSHIWRYLADAYEIPAFKSTLPSDQDIVFAYEKKATKGPSGKVPKPTLEKFSYTTTVPKEYLDNETNRNGNDSDMESQ